MKTKKFLEQWRFTIILIGAVTSGAILGHIIGPGAELLKPLGTIFLNLLYTAVVPLVFFSLSSAVAGSSSLGRLGRIAIWMIAIFIITGMISSCLTIGAVKIFNPARDMTFKVETQAASDTKSLSTRIVETVTVSDFQNLLTRQNMMALIVFAILTGLAAQKSGERGRQFRELLILGSEVMGYLIKLIMYYAPVGLAAYFAYLIGVFGPQLIGTYLRAVELYYPLSIAYFIIASSFYAFLAGGTSCIKRFWTHIPPVALTAWGTGSSLAALPSNLESAGRIGVPDDIREIVLPMAAVTYKIGSCMAAVLKIAILFTLFGKDFSGLEVYLTAAGISILSGTVMGGITGGGFLGEMLIVTMYGFGPEALPIISMLGMLVDPPATMVNATGDTLASMLVTRVVEGSDRLSGKISG